MIPVLVENFDLNFKVTVMTVMTVMVGTTEMENIWIFGLKLLIKLFHKVV